MVGSRGIIILAVAVLTACGQGIQLKHRAVQAPQNESQTGYLIDLSEKNLSDSETEQILSDLEDYGGKVRTINPAHGIYEVYGLSRALIEQYVPSDAIQKNKFLPKQKSQLELSSIYDAYCPNVPSAPKMELKALPASKHIVAEHPLVLSRDQQSLTFDVKFSEKTNYQWQVYGPPASAANNLKAANQSLSFAPDELGEYNVFLIVQLSDNKSCWRRFLIGLTEDVAYEGPTLAEPLPVDERLVKFPHLETLGLRQAWQKTLGEKSLIAFLDTGVDYNHPDIAPNLALNFIDANGDKRDNDNNKFIDDYLGWDFVNNDNVPYDDEMHGTHVAGLAASLVGVAPKAKILAVKVLGPFGGDIATVIGGLYYAIDRGAKIINLSLGGSNSSTALVRAFDYAQKRGVLVVVAAGNDSEDIDVNPTYPAALPHPNILTVAATDMLGNLTNYTNVGARNVDMASPGGSDTDGGLLSCFYKNRLNKRYVKAQGTSMAAPLVSGIAALLLSTNPKLNALELKKMIISHGITRTDYQGRIGSQKLVSAADLFEMTRP